MIELLLQAEGALSVGLLDRAETLYRQVERADPRNAIAVVGLSRVALERGRQQDALELARRALAIDPENVAAQRMVQRLEEVLAYRGEELPGSGAPGRRTDPATPPEPAAPPEPATPPEPETPAPSSVVDGRPLRRSLLDRLRGRR
jgi:tetratricopeptide (TPR) repeat protein